MSMDLFIPIRSVGQLKVADLNADLHRAGFNLTMSNVDLRQHSGFWPARFDGHAGGVEYYLGEARDAYFGLPSRYANCPELVSLTYGSQRREPVIAFALAAAIASLQNTEVYDAQSGAWIDAARSNAYARQYNSVLWRLMFSLFSDER